MKKREEIKGDNLIFWPCGHCQGAGGSVVESGLSLRSIRLKENISLRAVARAASLSAAFVSDVELGRRKANQALLDAYHAILKSALGRS